MNRELRDRWIAALESGEYEKGELRLATIEADGTTSFCCLGVLADVCDLLGEPEFDPGSGVKTRGVPDPDGSTWAATLPYEAPDCLVSEDDQWALVRVNDAADTFAPVVAKIRELFPDEVSG